MKIHRTRWLIWALIVPAYQGAASVRYELRDYRTVAAAINTPEK